MDIRAWWGRRSKNARRRLLFYPAVLLAAGGFVAFTSVMPGRSYRGPLPALDPASEALAVALRADVEALAVERHLGRPGTLPRARDVVEGAMRTAGLAPTRLPFDVDGTAVDNLEATVAGADRAAEIVVIGAHYDTAVGAPGADDNASGVAALLAIARALRTHKPARTLRFVAFANEEPPHFWNPSMGSLVYAKACKARGDDVVAMLSLETVGYYSDAHGSQKYPPIVSLLYPDQGNFIGFVGNLSSRGLVREAVGTFRDAARFPSEGAALPSFVTGVGWSDQWSFWQVGYPGVMVTDTAPFRNPNYHRATDTAATLDYDRFARVVGGLVEVVKRLGR